MCEIRNIYVTSSIELISKFKNNPGNNRLTNMSRGINPDVLIASVVSSVRQTFSAFGGDVKRLESDLKHLCRAYPNLRPAVENYIHINGTSEMLVKVDGIVPIHFRGNNYNIPVNVWIPSMYPQKQPTCYVTPTSSMIIKPGHTNVDRNGLVRFPYLQDWSPHHSTLVGLCTVMASVFSETPPVNSKPANYRGGQMQQPPRFQNLNSARRPSYETVVTGVVTPSSNTNQYTVDAVAVNPTGYSTTSVTATATPTLSSARGQRSGTGYSDHSSSRFSDGLPAYGDLTTSTPSNSYSSSKYDGTDATENNNIAAHQPTPLRKSSISEDEIHQIMRDAIQQKITLRCNKLKESIQVESKREDALNDGASKITRGLKVLQNDKVRLEKGIELLEERDKTLAEWVDAQEILLENQEEQSPDDLLQAKDTMSDQLFECAATIAAIEDVMYHLGRALQREVIDLNTYLKQIRNLASDQFMAKALALKIEAMQREEELRDRSRSGSNGGSTKTGDHGIPNVTNAPPSYESVWEGRGTNM